MHIKNTKGEGINGVFLSSESFGEILGQANIAKKTKEDKYKIFFHVVYGPQHPLFTKMFFGCTNKPRRKEKTRKNI